MGDEQRCHKCNQLKGACLPPVRKFRPDFDLTLGSYYLCQLTPTVESVRRIVAISGEHVWWTGNTVAARPAIVGRLALRLDGVRTTSVAPRCRVVKFKNTMVRELTEAEAKLATAGIVEATARHRADRATKRAAGRKAGFPTFDLRIDDATMVRLADLARKYETSRAEVIRMCVVEGLRLGIPELFALVGFGKVVPSIRCSVATREAITGIAVQRGNSDVGAASALMLVGLDSIARHG